MLVGSFLRLSFNSNLPKLGAALHIGVLVVRIAAVYEIGAALCCCGLIHGTRETALATNVKSQV